jgi:hypothetical protein
MYLECLCGNVMNDVAAPNAVEHLLLSYSAMERLQDLVDQEVSTNCEVNLWPEHWEAAGAVVVWKCPNCDRLYLNAKGPKENIVIYKIEKKGLE